MLSRTGPTQWIELFQKLKNLTGPVETRAWQVQTGETPCDAELRAPGISRSSAMMLKAKLSLMTRGDICLSRVTAESSRWASRDYTALQQELDHINLGGRSSRSFERRGRLSRTLGEPSRIPRILHQMAHGGGERGASVMLGATDWMERLHAQKHGWCVFYWSDAELAKLVHMYYPLLAPTYDALPLGTCLLTRRAKPRDSHQPLSRDTSPLAVQLRISAPECLPNGRTLAACATSPFVAPARAGRGQVEEGSHQRPYDEVHVWIKYFVSLLEDGDLLHRMVCFGAPAPYATARRGGSPLGSCRQLNSLVFDSSRSSVVATCSYALDAQHCCGSS
eukprot:6195036-Pleurochrysis_carterae.AAC.2